MPALPAIPYMIKAILTMAAPGVANIINRLFFQGTQQTNSTALNTAAQSMATSWSSALASVLSNQLALIGVQLEDLTNSAGGTGLWTGSKPGGIVTGSQEFPQAALVLKNLIADRYRGGHSRIYLPGVPASNLSSTDANTWNATSAAAIASDWQTFLGAAQTALQTAGCGTVAWAVPHYYKGHTWNHYGTAPNDWYKRVATPVAAPVKVDTYTAVGYNPVVGTQRRRTHQSV